MPAAKRCSECAIGLKLCQSLKQEEEEEEDEEEEAKLLLYIHVYSIKL